MTSYDVAWTVMCYLAAFAVVGVFALYMMAEVRAGKERRQDLWKEQQAQAAKEQASHEHP